MLSHRNLTGVLTQMAPCIGSYEHGQDVLLAVVPFYHIYGGSVIALLSFLKGVPIVILPKFEPELLLSSIEKYKITVRGL